MYRNKTARQHNFATVPRADIPRSKFSMRQTRKQAFNASDLVPIMVEEILPGDTWQHTESIMARLQTPIAPIIDDMDLETFYFFVPNRISDWGEKYWEEFITGADTSLEVPTIGPLSGEATYELKVNSVFDHMGLLPQVYTQLDALQVCAFPVWAYFQIWNEWFRDQNLQQPWEVDDPWPTNGTNDNIQQNSVSWDQMPLRVNKRHDYFTSSLPWPQKGTAVELPLGSTAPVIPVGVTPPTFTSTTGLGPINEPLHAKGPEAGANADIGIAMDSAIGANVNLRWSNPSLQVDLASATAATINALRLAFQTQKLLERDARGGSRYVEQLLSHFGVRSPDYRLQRPEYLGGSRIAITVNPIAQTAPSGITSVGLDSAQGNMAAEMHASGHTRTFTYAATEHGYIIGLACVRATPTYQQGTRRHWRRATRLDYYWPVFAMLGEQAIPTQEIMQPADGTPTTPTWGYQERWAEYRYTPNEITGTLRSTVANPMDWWHLSEEFATEPQLNGDFITDKTQEVLARALAVTEPELWSAQIIMDILHESTVARLMPTYSVPGLIDHF